MPEPVEAAGAEMGWDGASAEGATGAGAGAGDGTGAGTAGAAAGAVAGALSSAEGTSASSKGNEIVISMSANTIPLEIAPDNDLRKKKLRNNQKRTKNKQRKKGADKA
mmetsp:Transcript_25793/g.57933  ORF Transcript_25793/g.57933 Transcript_25793/m.57933 type:complete len:108 (+) Transcript_25793:1732-2055(+)